MPFLEETELAEHQIEQISVNSLDINSEAQFARATITEGGERDMDLTGSVHSSVLSHQQSYRRPRSVQASNLCSVDFQESERALDIGRTRQSLVQADCYQSRGQTESQSEGLFHLGGP